MEKFYDHAAIEKKWRARWQAEKLYEVDPAKVQKPFYCLDMFPYPSGDGLHVGHWRGYVLSDFYARYHRLKGYDVLHPMGYDAFGLPSERAAIKYKSHPKKFTDQAIKNFSRQLDEIGAAFDWTKTISTADPNYYHWTQWLFLQFFRHGLAEKRRSLVNWCPNDQTVLANEQVVNGCCERCGAKVTKKELAQWFLKTTAFAQELIEGLEKVSWPEHVKTLQRNWIGKSDGAEIEFRLADSKITVFTTRPDTLFGVTALVLAPEHPLAESLVKDKQKDFAAYQKEVAAKTNVDRQQGKESAKTAFFTGSYALHPLTDEKIPVWLADYVLIEYGTGAVMCVPAHDERDLMFATTHHLPVKQVIQPETGQKLPDEQFRRSIIAIIENPKTGKYLTLNWGKELGGQLFIGGGIEEGESPVATAQREIREETGYADLEFVSQTEPLYHHYRAFSKNVNRIIEVVGLYFRLKSDRKVDRQLMEDEKDNFKIEWLDKSQAERLVIDESHHLAFEFLINKQIYSGTGRLTHSGEFDGLSSTEATKRIVGALKDKKLGKETTTYRLRDWLVSRQRYWGAPIPIVYDPAGQAHPVKDEHLPLRLPTDVDFLPGGESPLERSAEYKQRAEKLYGKGWRFETDTLDTFVDSSWYFLRYLSPADPNEAFRPELVKRWLPIDLYVGGIEHATLHLLYCRFVTKFLAKYGYIDQSIDEPVKMLYNIGMINLNGAKMSKSQGNVISPDQLVEHYGTDALRGYELFIGPMDIEAEWNPRGINGIHRFLIKLWQLAQTKVGDGDHEDADTAFARYLSDIEPMIADFRLNTVIAAAMKLLTTWEKSPVISRKTFGDFLITLSPIFPFVSEELYQRLENERVNSIFQTSWPERKHIEATKNLPILVDQKFVAALPIDPTADESTIIETAKAHKIIARKLGNRRVIKTIYKVGQLVNFITGK